MQLSIVVPILNEADTLAVMLAPLLEYQGRGHEVILVDGGSLDESVAIARSAGFKVISAPKGRASQLNAGAAQGRGDVLLFLHADTLLPDRADLLIADAMKGVGRVWGRFDVVIRGAPLMLKVVAALMNFRSRLSGIATGDQAIFISRKAFKALGGFPLQPLMEDIEFSRLAKALSSPVCLRQRVSTSGRRWETRGVWRTIVLMWCLRFAYWAGVSPTTLARVYSR